VEKFCAHTLLLHSNREMRMDGDMLSDKCKMGFFSADRPSLSSLIATRLGVAAAVVDDYDGKKVNRKVGH
jgi:hypothetical protein